MNDNFNSKSMTILYMIRMNMDIFILLSNNDNQKSSMQFDNWKIYNYSGLELYIQVSVVLYIYSITVDVHKCVVLLSQHHPGQPVRRLNTPSKKFQQFWPCVQRHFIMNKYLH